MKIIFTPLVLASAITAAFLHQMPVLREGLAGTFLWLAAVGLFAVIDLVVRAFLWLWRVCTAARETYCEFEEPEDDAVIEGDVGPLVECDTAGTPAPPNEVQVYEYLWNPVSSAYELTRVVPLTEYTVTDPDAAQILSRTPTPSVIPGAPVPVKRTPPEESEFDEIELRLQAPAFRDRTRHSMPIDRPGKEF